MKWQIFKEIDVPCAEISYQWVLKNSRFLVITMHFSRVIGGYTQDLELVFSDPIALKWEDESYDVIQLPTDLPKCSQDGFTVWTYPTLIIPDSDWADLYAAATHTEAEYKNHQIKHFAFLSMNDLVHVLSKTEPSSRLITRLDE